MTMRKRREKALSESEAKMRSIVDTAVDGIILIDERGIIDAFNPAAERIFGYQANEVIGRNVSMLMPSPYHEEHDRYLASYLATGERKIIGIGREVSGRRKDGTIFPLDLAVSEVCLDDRRLFTGILRDITERKRAAEERRSLEEQLRQSQKLESLGTLAGGIAHDFKNILAIISGCASLLDSENVKPETFSEAVKAIDVTVQRGAGLVQQLLMFARKTPVRFELVNVTATIEEIVKMLVHTFPKTIQFSLQLHQHSMYITADANQLHQALLNLCVNARDAMPDGGTLSISTDMMAGAQLVGRFPEVRSEQYIGIRVTDTGDGMNENTKRRIFEPFFTTKAPGQGSGLGLAVVYGIVRDHRGFIDVESEIGRGTTFHLYFPTAQVESIEVAEK